MNTPTVAEVRTVCRELGLSFRRISETREFVIGGSYYTDDAQDAIDTARAMPRTQQKQAKAIAYAIDRKHEQASEAKRRYDAQMREFELNERHELEILQSEVNTLREQLRDVLPASTRVPDSVKHQPLREGWQRWHAHQTATHGRPYTRTLRNLIHFAQKEMSHYNTAYHAGQTCVLP